MPRRWAVVTDRIFFRQMIIYGKIAVGISHDGTIEERWCGGVKNGKSILRKMLVPMMLVMSLQAGLFLGSILLGGTLDKLNQNSVDILNERVINRKNYLQNEMLQRWSNLDESVQIIQSSTASTLSDYGITAGQLRVNSPASTELLDRVSENLIYTLRKQSVTGIFLVLNGGDDPYQTTGVSKSGVYLRDLDSLSNADDNSDILVERAPSSITQRLGVTMDTNWSPQFQFTDALPAASYDFFYKPFRAAVEYPDIGTRDLGYWSRPFRFSENDIEVITYSVPLRDGAGTPYGVLGVEISADYIRKLLPYDEIASEKAGSYLLGMRTGAEMSFENLLESGPIYKQLSGGCAETLFEQAPSYQTGYAIRNDENLSHDAYGCIQYFNLYNTNTPFENERWALIGVLESDRLFGFSTTLRSTILIAMAVSLMIGLFSVALIVRFVTNPITQLVRKVKTSNPHLPVRFERTHIAEVDELASAVESLSANVAESASKLSAIIEMSSVAIGAFEYRLSEGKTFYTKHLFDILGIADSYHDNGYMDNGLFAEKMRSFVGQRDSREGDGISVYRVIDEQGRPRWVRLKIVEDEDKTFGVVEDITQEMIEKKKIEYERDYDLLTNLLNRRAFYTALDRLFIHPDQLGYGSMVMFDLDNLKYINDTYGHDYGDRYIRGMADALRKGAPHQAVVSRLSGDEFYLFLYGCSDRESADEQVKRIKDTIDGARFPLPDNDQFRIRASAGVSRYPEDSRKYEQLVRYADFAMYTVKNTVKGEICQFNHEEYRKDSYLLSSREDLNRLIDENLVTYHFQPIVSTKTGAVFGYEALMRSQLDTLRSPSEILTLARAQSKLYQIERLTWFGALADFTRQQTAAAADSRLFINSISNQSLTARDLDELEKRYMSLLSRVVIELTESEKQNDVFIMVKKECAAKWGAELALDDFGTGYNGETMLLQLAPRYVKIDMSIVRDIDSDGNRQTLLRNVLSYTKERDMYVIAEGVETREEMEMLIRSGVDYLQGFYLAEPAEVPPTLHLGVTQEIQGIQKSMGSN